MFNKATFQQILLPSSAAYHYVKHVYRKYANLEKTKKYIV